MTRRLWLVGVKRGRAGVCDACRNDDHANCAPVPVVEDGLGRAREGTGYVECKCLCMPEWMRTALDNGWQPPERAGEGNRRSFYEDVMPDGGRKP